jgi:hypothetical protein
MKLTNSFGPRYGEPDDAGGARRVKYSSERPKFDPLVSVSVLDNMTDERCDFFFRQNVFYKESGMGLRARMGLKQADKMLQNPTGNLYLFSTPL